MKIDVAAVRKCLKSFDFRTLFREHLGWDNHQAQLDIPVDGTTVQLNALAQKRGFVAFLCPSIPDRPTRLKIDHQITKSAREHFVIYADQPAGQQVWHWVRREPGKPLASRDHRFDSSQSGDPLIQRLDQIAVSLDEEEKITVVEVAGRARAAFDVDKVTKKFYDRFKTEHTALLKLIKGIKADAELHWYTSVMLNRLMFVYFIQKKGFLDGDTDYLRNRLAMVRQIKGKDKFQSFYRYFLLRLFHDGLGKSPDERKLDAAMEKLLGKVPYLNGGFFEVHQLEEHNPDIDIPDKAFEKLFDFFDQYSWHLDERPLRDDNEINPDVVGYIFEKYVNQKQMGAYYTKEDITEYISKNTIIPFLFDASQKKCAIAFKPESALWRLLRDDPDRYIYPAVRHGVVDIKGNIIALPKDIEAGVKDVAKRDGWNKSADDLFGLPTETWREHIARRQRCLDIRAKLSKGEVSQINDLITLNLDIWQFARDAIVNAEGPELLRAFWHAIEKVTVLDPTCGSGAFLFAALRILETLYSDCLERMERLIQDADHAAAVTPEDQVQALITAGEGTNVEFKSSARWDIKQNQYNPVMEEVVVKTVAGFLNGYGGTLLIGVDDAGKVLGLANDYQHTKKDSPNRDKFELWLSQHLTSKLGKPARHYISIDFACFDGMDVCRVIVYQSGQPVFVDKSGQEILYARQGNATVPYTKASEILAYKEQHWPSDQPTPNPPPPVSAYVIASNRPTKQSKRPYPDLRQCIEHLAKHPNERYFILKSIIINNLFGVDIMEEAVEICKLRLFLKLVAQVENVSQIEPLPDIDFNIRAGNTLVGYATLDQVHKSQEGKLGFTDKLIKRIEEDAEMVEKAFNQFRAQQTTHGGKVTRKDKQELRTRLAKLDVELDRYLAGEYGVNVGKQKDLDDWKASHEPFHWFVEFYGIMSAGGFDVIIGNPPYVELKEVRKYQLVGYNCQRAGNLYAVMLERAFLLHRPLGKMGFIVPVSSVSTDRYEPLQRMLSTRVLHYSSFDDRPSRLFEGLEHIRLTIHLIGQSSDTVSLRSTRYNKWNTDERAHLFQALEYTLATPALVTCTMPKLSTPLEAHIVAKLQAQKAKLADFYVKSGKHLVLYSRKVGYFLQVLDFVPEVRDGKGRLRPPSEFKEIAFSDPQMAKCALCCLNANLFYWFVTVYSDCRHVNKREVDLFPINLQQLANSSCGPKLITLASRLMKDVDSRSEHRKMTFKHDSLTVQCIFPKRSKPILDEIDAVLARHYGFTPEELDFIINYDVKYRIGTNNDDGD